MSSTAFARARILVTFACLGLACASSPALAQEAQAPAEAPLPAAFALPWSDQAVRPAGPRLSVVRVGHPDRRIGRLAPRRLAARRAAEARAREALHAYVDDALARANASPQVARAAHAAIEEGVTVEALRPLSDGGVVILASIPKEALRRAAAVEGAPWMR